MKNEKRRKISYEMIQAMTNSTYFYRGESYYHSGKVVKAWITEDGIKAKVRGSYKPYYHVEIEITDTMELFGECSCPIGWGCKHCVAACLQYLYDSESFIELKTSMIGTFGEKSHVDKEIIEIADEYKLKPISVNEYIDSILEKELKNKFVKLWDYFSPEFLDGIVDPDYPFKFWIKNLVSIINFDRENLKINSVRKAYNWFKPLEFLSFLGPGKFYIPLLYNWCESYIRLGISLREKFEEYGIGEGNIEYDPDYYFVDDYDDSDRWDYDSSSISDEYFSQYEDTFVEMGEFYEILLKEQLSELAEDLYKFGIGWFLDLDLDDYKDYGLYNICIIQRNLDEQLKSVRVLAFKGKERIDFLLQLYLEFKSQQIKDKLFYELDQMEKKTQEDIRRTQNPVNTEELIISIWNEVLKSYKFRMNHEIFFFLAEFCERFSKDEKKIKNLIKLTLLNIEKHEDYPGRLINSVLNYYQEKSHQNIEMLYFLMIRGEFDGKSIESHIYKKNERALCSSGFEWFLKYYLPKGDIEKIIELSNCVLRNSPIIFKFNHYMTIKNYSNYDKIFQETYLFYLKNEFLPSLIKKRQFHVGIKIFLEEKEYSEAISLSHSHFDVNLVWFVIQKLYSEIITEKKSLQLNILKSDYIDMLFEIINKYINDSMKLNSRYRPDYNISQAVQLKILLFKKYKNEDEGNKWFTQFCKKYKRFHNLRNSLRSLGIEMV